MESERYDRYDYGDDKLVLVWFSLNPTVWLETSYGQRLQRGPRMLQRLWMSGGLLLLVEDFGILRGLGEDR